MTEPTSLDRLRDLLREQAARLSLDPATVTSPTPAAITAHTRDGQLLRLDVASYPLSELAL